MKLATCSVAGCAYAAGAFAIGFVLGTVRVLVLGPAIGATAAVLLEAPFILAASWVISRWCLGHFELHTSAEAAMMGTIAFAVLMGGELGVTVLVFGKSASEHLDGYRSLPGMIGLAAQLAFACFPLLQART
ncbi:hypothetical protein [Cupriavidus sp. UYPR2.512]|uniref:hypothetical protein n=1 Tax=Cupriavidus sp. UYPR2.512 TaxID=1080187 RepID=UPI0012FBE398|nr:hypothetical protein [Cupriavidus sp. UYPR2.512]UIF84748.1 hypothetical protein KAF44_10860 [Cupriavidus necator]